MVHVCLQKNRLRKIRDYLTTIKMWNVISFLMQKSRTFLHPSITAIENTNYLLTYTNDISDLKAFKVHELMVNIPFIVIKGNGL